MFDAWHDVISPGRVEVVYTSYTAQYTDRGAQLSSTSHSYVSDSVAYMHCLKNKVQCA